MTTFSVGISALNAAQTGILTTSHNIANASTPGFTRQQIVQTTNTPMFTGAGFLGQGTNVQTIQRIYNQYISRQLMSAQTGAAEMDSYLAQIQQIDNLLADPSAGLSPSLSAFFKGVQDMAASPASIPARQATLSAAQALVARFQGLDQRITEIRDGVNQQVTDEVAKINTLAVQLGDINQRIILAQASGANVPANDLIDQRDQLISDINKEIRTSTVQQGDGTYSIFIGTGQPLVVGTQVSTFLAEPDNNDPTRITVALKTPYGATMQLSESLLTGGTLGGLLAFRNQSLDAAQNALGRIALTLGQNFNDQHQLGQDLTGALGGNFFDLSFAGPTVRANIKNAIPSQMPTVTVSNVGSLSTSDYQLGFLGGNYTLTRLSDGHSWSNAALAGLPWPVDGITVTAGTWTPVAGDSFLIEPTRAAATNIALAISDPRAIAAAAPIRTAAALANIGTGSVSAGTVNGPPPPNANLQQAVTITFDNPPGTFDVVGIGTGNPTNVAYTAGGSITYNGWTIQISGAPAANDVFTIGPNLNGVADSRNAVLMGVLQTANTMEGGTATYQSAYSRIVSEIGNKTREVQVTGQAQQSLADQAQSARDQVSGVNLDEEAAKLMQYQQAYQAAAKMIDIAGKLFDEVLALGR